MSNKVEEINVFEKLFFEEDIKYIIPLYQRAFAWERNEIFQLIEDINDIKSDTENYFLGTLIVAKDGKNFEVIDGQQRLTALYLLFNVLGIQTPKILSFDCREKSNYTLNHLNEENLNKVECEETLLRGIEDIKNSIREKEKEDNNFINQFKEKLSKVKLYRIEVPENTDLNRYFEIMNTRGEQLEQTDILKASLMSYIIEDKQFGDEEKLSYIKSQIFAKVWDACSDMNTYVQMNFNNLDRGKIFTEEWNKIPILNNLQNEEIEKSKNQDNNKKEITIDIIDTITKEDIEKENNIEDKESKKRFESIINFPYFLLHALRIFVKKEKIVSREGKALFGELLDDKELVNDFKSVVENGMWKDSNINREQFAMAFIDFLLKLRFLFDKYIIKRQYTDDDKNGEWSLKELKVSNSSNNKNAYPINTIFAEDNEKINKMNLMIQSCLRVSYISPKIMHWITELLSWLYEKQESCNLENSINEYLGITEKIARKACKEFLNTDNFDNMGVNTPHIVFNYLDYLLWKAKSEKIDFDFEFRNSVEHWYPQHPSKGTFDQWTHEEGLDNFGNLCLIQREVNSEFSNLAPSAKKTTFVEKINKGSLKLRKMNQLTIDTNGQSADKYWKETGYKLHGEEMIELLKKDCFFNNV